MVELAVNVINVFVSAIPNVSQNPFVVDRIPLLMHVISNSSAETIETILNILLVLATKSQGSRKILQCENLGRIIDTSVNHSVASQVLDHAFSNSISDIGVIRDSLERVCRELCNRLDKENCQRALRHKILSILAGLVTRIPSEILHGLNQFIEGSGGVSLAVHPRTKDGIARLLPHVYSTHTLRISSSNPTTTPANPKHHQTKSRLYTCF